MPISRTVRERLASGRMVQRGGFVLTVLALATVVCGSEGCSKGQESAGVQDAPLGGRSPLSS